MEMRNPCLAGSVNREASPHKSIRHLCTGILVLVGSDRTERYADLCTLGLLGSKPCVQNCRGDVMPAPVVRDLNKPGFAQTELICVAAPLGQTDGANVSGEQNAIVSEGGVLYDTAFIRG